MLNYSILSDDELIRLIQSDDDLAFTEIYKRYWEQLLAVGFYHTRDKAQAEDILQDVMVSLWTRRRSIQIHSLKAYLATAVKFSVFKSIAQSNRQRQIREDKNYTEGFSNIEENLDAQFLQEYLSGILEQLPEKTRLVFYYRRVEELSVSEAAKKMRLSTKAIEYHLTRALRAFKKILKKVNTFLH